MYINLENVDLDVLKNAIKAIGDAITELGDFK